jgi:hypothetical protein
MQGYERGAILSGPCINSDLTALAAGQDDPSRNAIVGVIRLVKAPVLLLQGAIQPTRRATKQGEARARARPPSIITQ